MAQRLTSPISEQLKAGASTKNAEPLNHYQYEKPISDNYDNIYVYATVGPLKQSEIG